MTTQRTDEMLKAISANEEARKKLDQVFDKKLNGWFDKYSTEDLIEAVFDKYCK